MNTMEIAEPQTELSAPGNSAWRDWIGIVASVGCAIHCAAMPFVFAYLPAWGLSFLADEAFHKWMALACFLIAIVAFIPGIIKHRSWVPVSIGSMGLIVITYAAFGLEGKCCPSCSAKNETTVVTVSDTSNEESDCCDEECEHCHSESSSTSSDKSGETATSFLSQFAPWITPIGGVLLVAAHLLNRRYGALCGCCASTPEPSAAAAKTI